VLWLTVGIVVGAGTLYLYQRAKAAGLELRWYVYALFLVGLVDLLGTIEVVMGSLAEADPEPAMKFLFLGVVVLAVTWGGAWQLAVKGSRSVSKIARA